jgi:hypothetical protein
MNMASAADEFKEELQRLAHVAKIRDDERKQTSELALRLFGPIRDFLLRFNEALGEFGKIEVAGPYPVGKYQHATATVTNPSGRAVSWEFVLSDNGVSYQRTPYQLSEYGRLESQLKSDVVSFLEKV